MGFDIPWEVRSAIFVEDFVGADCVFVFAVDQETVHVEETCFDAWQPDLEISCEREDCISLMVVELTLSLPPWWSSVMMVEVKDVFSVRCRNDKDKVSAAMIT